MGSDHCFIGDMSLFTVNSSLCYWGQISVLLRSLYLGGIIILVFLSYE